MNNSLANMLRAIDKAIDDNDLERSLPLIDALRTTIVDLQATRAKDAAAGHPGRRMVSQPIEGTTEYWCPTCELYWLERDR